MRSPKEIPSIPSDGAARSSLRFRRERLAWCQPPPASAAVEARLRRAIARTRIVRNRQHRRHLGRDDLLCPVGQFQHAGRFHLGEEQQNILCGDLLRQRPVDVPIRPSDGVGPGPRRPPDLEFDWPDTIVPEAATDLFDQFLLRPAGQANVPQPLSTSIATVVFVVSTCRWSASCFMA